MKVLFLDIDGVLNTSLTYFENKRKKVKNPSMDCLDIDEFRLRYLKEIVDSSSCQIVLTSSWRTFFHKEDGLLIGTGKGKQLLDLFQKYGLSIYDITPFDSNRWRENEIERYLEENDVDSFVIVDDESVDLHKFRDHLVLISTKYGDFSSDNGLLEKHVSMVLQKFKVYQKTINYFL